MRLCNVRRWHSGIANCAILVVLALLLNACGDGSVDESDSSDYSDSAQYFSITGMMTGLPDGQKISLTDGAGDNQVISNNGDFNFDTTITTDSALTVNLTVTSQPKGAKCSATTENSAGDIAANLAFGIVTVQVTCNDQS